jgi:hypothetical protein
MQENIDVNQKNWKAYIQSILRTEIPSRDHAAIEQQVSCTHNVVHECPPQILLDLLQRFPT